MSEKTVMYAEALRDRIDALESVLTEIIDLNPYIRSECDEGRVCFYCDGRIGDHFSDCLYIRAKRLIADDAR